MQSKLRKLPLPWLIVAQFFFLACAPDQKNHAEKSDADPNWLEYQFSYQLEIPAQKKKKTIKVWLPLPAQNKSQKLISKKIIAPLKWQETKENRYGNQLIFFEGEIGLKPTRLELNYIIRKQADHGIAADEISLNKYDDPALYTGPNKYLPDLPLFRNLAQEILKGFSPNKLSDEEKIKKFYSYVVQSMTYDKKGEGWGKGDAVWACLNKKGNCTDFHSLFIALARTQKISARFRIGFPAKYENKLNEIHGYHCWAEAFIPGKGWLPLDATEGKKSAKPLEFFGQIPANRILFSTERDINLMPRQSGAALNYFIYPYVELDGRLDNDYQKKFFVRAKIDS